MEKKLIDYDGFEAYSKSVRKKYADKVDKVVGKQLSTNDYTNEDKKKVDAIPDNPKYTDTVPDLSGYATKKELYDKVNKWDISNETDGNSTDKVFSQQAVNYMVGGLRTQLYRYIQDLDEKADTKDIPKKLSQLTNDKTFKTESEIQSMIEKASSLKKEVVTSLPTTGKDDVIYLVKDEKGKDNNNYLEYLWLNGKYELIGSTQVDLSDYLKTKDLKNAKLRTNKNNIHVFTDRSKSETDLDIILGDLELRTEQNKKNIKTKLSEMTDDSTHRLVTDTEKETWNNKLDKTKDKAVLDSRTDYSNNTLYTTPYFVQQTIGIQMLEHLESFQQSLDEELKKTLKSTDIQEFTQQELEEAFK